MAVLEILDKNACSGVFKHRLWLSRIIGYSSPCLTPTYFLALWMLFVTYMKYAGNGPFVVNYSNRSTTCQKYWWFNMLYINNFAPDEMQCMGHTFYLANDMQFYMLSPILLISFTRSIRRSMFIAVSIIVGCCTASGLLGVINDFPITMDLINLPPGSEEYNTAFDVSYSKPYVRIGPYIVGMLTGFFIYKESSITMSKAQVALGWVISLTTMLTIIYSAMYAYTIGIFAKFLYHAFGKLAWSLSIAWILVASISRYGGPINSILSLRIWNPMSRLTYIVYLWHNGSIASRLGLMETSIHYATMPLNIIIVSNIIFAFGEAVILCLLFESPFVGLEGVLLRRKKTAKDEKFCS